MRTPAFGCAVFASTKATIDEPLRNDVITGAGLQRPFRLFSFQRDETRAVQLLFHVADRTIARGVGDWFRNESRSFV